MVTPTGLDITGLSNLMNIFKMNFVIIKIYENFFSKLKVLLKITGLDIIVLSNLMNNFKRIFDIISLQLIS